MTSPDKVPGFTYSKSGDKNRFNPTSTSSVLEDAASWARAQRRDMTFKCVRLTLLNPSGQPIADANGKMRVASGFLRKEGGVLFLYTCWHVVTGIDFLQPKLPAIGGGRATRLRVSLQLATPAIAGASEQISGEHDFQVALYDDDGQFPLVPRWEQFVQCRQIPEIESAGLRVPRRFDVVRLNLTGTQVPFVSDLQLVDATLWTNAIDPGDQLYVAGFPFGFTGDGDDLEAVLLSRRCAESSWKDSGYGTFLDSPCAPGMSGGPVLLEIGGHLFLAGLYTGARFPDAPAAQPDKAAALGIFCPFAIPLIDGQLVHARGIA